MPIPSFIAELRAKVGTDLLWLTGVSAAVFDDRGRVLLTHRSDTHKWALVSGVLEPGEQPAVAMVKEIREETGVEAVIEGLAALRVEQPATYPNGDQAQYLDLLFAARATGGQAHVGDDESIAVDWFALDSLPENTGHFTAERLTAVATFLANPAGGTLFSR